MKLHSQITLRPDLLYLAPLINVVFLLLIFFLLNSNLVVRSGMRVELPPSDSSLRPLERAHTVTVTAGEEPQIFLNGEPVVRGDLAAELLKIKHVTRNVLVAADQAAPHGVVQSVLNAVSASGCEAFIMTQMEP